MVCLIVYGQGNLVYYLPRTCVKLLHMDATATHLAFVWVLISVYNHSAMMEHIHTAVCTSARTRWESALLDNAHGIGATEQISSNFTPGESG